MDGGERASFGRQAWFLQRGTAGWPLSALRQDCTVVVRFSARQRIVRPVVAGRQAALCPDRAYGEAPLVLAALFRGLRQSPSLSEAVRLASPLDQARSLTGPT